jgi:nucleoside-diphosphate-sugar epimerase
MTTHATQAPRILFIGGGALSRPVAERLAAQHDVWVMRRSAITGVHDIHPVVADVTAPDSLSALPGNVDVVIYCLTPPDSSAAGYQSVFVDGLRNVLPALRAHSPNLKRIFFISSTSVYGQDDDSRVDEHSPCHPETATGAKLLEAENLLLASGLPATVLRLSGIYGPGRRRLLDTIVQGKAASSVAYTNRIHEADAQAAIQWLSERALAGQALPERLLVSDCEPVGMCDLVRWVRERAPCAQKGAIAEPAMRRAGSKQCDNRRLRDTGFVFRYPSFREGYGEMLGLTRSP